MLNKSSQILKCQKKTSTVLIDNKRQWNHYVSYETVNSSNSYIKVIVISQTELIVIVVVLHFF